MKPNGDLQKLTVATVSFTVKPYGDLQKLTVKMIKGVSLEVYPYYKGITKSDPKNGYAFSDILIERKYCVGTLLVIHPLD